MLYKKNLASSLSDELFQSPTSEFRATPFWSWNCKLDKAQLERQIDHMKQMGFGGFHMHSRTGLDTEYLSDEFMAMVTACCDKAENEEMLAWLYDEDRFPSGAAGGIVTAYPPFRRKALRFYSQDKGWELPKEQALETGKPYLLACYDIVLDADGYLAEYRKVSREAPQTGLRWYAYVVPDTSDPWYNGQTYLDTMDREAVRKFIDVTHERYKEVIGDRFDKSVPAIFTDEPNAATGKVTPISFPENRDMVTRAWSRYFEETYRAEYGEDLLDKLPELIWNRADGADSVIKYRYFDLVAKLFSENFCGQIGDWCEANNIALTGHLLSEPNLRGQAHTAGDFMRCYGHFGIPGVDMLCDARELTTAKQVQSAVHQYGKEAMMSELYGVTNWDFDFRGHKLQGDWQAALGVTVRVPHLVWLSMAGEAKRDYPAAIGYQSPWYQEYPVIEDHFARLNTALTRGKPIVRVGVIHPIESYWLLTGPNSLTGAHAESLRQNHKNITQWLLESHLDFDFIGESTIPELSDPQDPGKLGLMRYDAIVIPNCLTLRQTTVDYLDTFRKAGGRVIFTGSCPAYVSGEKSDGCRALYAASQAVSCDVASIAAALEPVRCVAMRNEEGHLARELVYQYRQDTDCRWLFVARAHPLPQKDVLSASRITVTVDGIFTPIEYDTVHGGKLPVTYTHQNGKTVIEKVFHGCDSLLLQLSDGCPLAAAEDTPYQTMIPLHPATPVSYTLSEANVLLLDQAQWALDDEPLQPKEEILRLDNLCRQRLDYPYREGHRVQPYLTKPSADEHILHLRFTFESQIRVTDAALAIEDPDKVRIFLNGAEATQPATGWFTDESIGVRPLPPIQVGENVLDVEIPYHARADVEWCYLLGNFGVRMAGTAACLTTLPEKLGFGTVTDQALPFYGANVTYHMEVDVPQDGDLKIHASSYRGSLIGVCLDGKRVDSIILPPYNAIVKDVPAGHHTVSLTLFGNRHNSFAPLHLVNEAERWIGPKAWRTEGDNWCYEYKLKPFGILKQPQITLCK